MESEIPELTSAQLVEAVESGGGVHVLDVRAPFRLESGKIDIVPSHRFHNIKGSELLGRDEFEGTGLVADAPIAVVCGLGNDSKRIAKHLNDHGFDAASLEGGMAAWMNALVARELEAPEGLDRFVQFDRIGKGALGYLLVSDGEALIVDPPRITDPILDVVREAGVNVVGIADTHAHADYISGGPTLAVELDVPYYLHAADAVYPYDGTPGKIRYQAAEHGARIPVGRAAVEIEHTPGHTEGSLTFRLGEHLALTGDFIFVASVGRPDLGGKTEEWTKVLFSSLARAKHDWPGTVRVYPAHYSGAGERNEDHSIGQPFARLCLTNEPLAMDDEHEFAAWVRSKTRPFPEAYKKMKAINIGLEMVDDIEAEELEVGKNQCALG